MAISTQNKGINGVTVVFSDGTGTPLTCTMVGENGDFSVDNISGENDNVIVRTESRGVFDSSHYAGVVYPQISFSFKFRQFTYATAANPIDFLKRRGFFSAAISTHGGTAGQRVWAFDVIYTAPGTAVGDDANHVITYNDCEVETLSYTESAEGSSFAVTLVCTGGVTIS